MTATSQFTAQHVLILDGNGRPGPMGPIAGLALGTLLSETLARVDDLEAGVVVGDISTALTGAATLNLADNEAAAWTVKQASNPYLLFVTTNGTERVKVAQRLTTTDGIASGTERVVGGVAYSGVAASAPLTGTTESQTSFDTDQYTIPAGSLKVGTVVRIHFTGLHTAATGTEVHTILVTLGGANIAATGNVDPAANDVFRGWFEFVVRSAGVGGTIVGDGLFTCGPRAATPTTTHTLATGATSTSTTAVDTTIDNLVTIAIDRQASATDGDSCRLDRMTVEIIG